MNAKIFTSMGAMCCVITLCAQVTPVSQMENIDRGIIVTPNSSGSGRFISWRLLGTDSDLTSFDILRDGEILKSNIMDATCYSDATGLGSNKYQIVTKVNGEPTDTSDVADAWSSTCFQIQLDRPEGGTNGSGSYTYTPNDCSVGDVDGDGKYELIVKWDPSDAQDNSNSGYTGNVFIDCYRFDGTKLWRIDLGVNIRAGAHYTQFLVYDFDGDGKAEMILKTAPGSIDGKGNYVSSAADDEDILTVDNTKDWRYSSSNTGKISGGQEWLTVFEGETGKAIHTIFYRPNRNPDSDGTPTWGGAPSPTFNWGGSSKTDTSYGNRGERYLATVAYLDGPESNPSAVMCRGYYTYAYLWAVDFDGSKLSTKWLHASVSTTKTLVYDANDNKTSKSYSTNTRGSGSKTAYGNGNHNLSCGDVDGDGKDEIIWGSCAIDDDGYLLYATGYGHGDAIHFSDLIPSRPGLEVFQIHEESPYGWDVHDAATGEIIWSATGDSDNGRGMSADIDSDNAGFEFWSSNDSQVRSAETGSVISSNSAGSTNFRIYWDGDLRDELFDGKYSSSTLSSSPVITKWGGSSSSTLQKLSDINGTPQSCNTTKATPSLQADIFGDWREELLLWENTDPSIMYVYTTNTTTSFRLPTLMHDHIYRLGVAWQNVAYNQPPHLGYYPEDIFNTRYILIGKGEFEQTVNVGDSIEAIVFKWLNCANPSLYKSFAPDGTSKTAGAVAGFKYTRDAYTNKTITIEGAPEQEGVYEFVILSGKNVIDSSTQYDTIRIYSVENIEGIKSVKDKSENVQWVNLIGNNENVVLKFNLNEAQDVNIGIVNLAGKQVYNTTYFVGNNAPVSIGGVQGLPSGVYIINVKSKEGKYTKKIIKH